MPSGKTAVRGGEQLVVGCFLDEAARHLSRNKLEQLELDRSYWLRLLPQKRRCSLDPDLNHGHFVGQRLALASSCERIGHAIPFLPTEGSGSVELGIQSKILTGASHRPLRARD